MSTDTTASVSTHVLDTGVGRPAEGVRVTLSARTGAGAPWAELGASRTDGDGRCKDLPALPARTAHVRLDFGTEAYFAADGTEPEKRADARQNAPRVRGGGAFFPEVTITFAVTPGEHHHVPLLLSPFGYSVYRGS
ncbi:hydroxyisourate hydrolase [Streptomyces sp. BBFR102]|uniref:hydroxyisourate hydrolase n=1 Tax=Streptomyces sp. BBFR102 TaxID=3448171 RepID=UPI003F536303